MLILQMIKHRHREVKLSWKSNRYSTPDRLVLLERVAQNNFSTKVSYNNRILP